MPGSSTEPGGGPGRDWLARLRSLPRNSESYGMIHQDAHAGPLHAFRDVHASASHAHSNRIRCNRSSHIHPAASSAASLAAQPSI